MKKIFIELFGGVGGFRLGFERLDSGWENEFFSQWEPKDSKQWAHKCYVEHFGDCIDQNGESHTNEDITNVDKASIPDHTLLMAGLPCQDYSVAQSLATSKGIEGKSGVLWWQIRDVLIAKRPPFCIFENVDRLLSSPAKQRGRDFGIILACLNELGYSAEWRIVNSAEYGSPQRRKRVFIFAYRNDTNYGKTERSEQEVFTDGFMAKSFTIVSVEKTETIVLPKDIKDVSDNFAYRFKNEGYMHDGVIYTTTIKAAVEAGKTLRDVLQKNVPEEYYLTDEQIEKMKNCRAGKRIPRIAETGFEYFYTEGAMAFPDPIDKPSRTIITSEKSIRRESHVILDPQTNRLRKLTPVEVERLQGFDDGWTAGLPESKRYFCMGNALVVPMVTRMGKVLDTIVENETPMMKEEVEKEAPATFVKTAVALEKIETPQQNYQRINGSSKNTEAIQGAEDAPINKCEDTASDKKPSPITKPAPITAENKCPVCKTMTAPPPSTKDMLRRLITAVKTGNFHNAKKLLKELYIRTKNRIFYSLKIFLGKLRE